MQKLLIVCVVFVGWLAGCNSDPGFDRPGAEHAALRLVDDCADLEQVLKDNAIAEMRERVQENLQWALEWGACGGWYYEDGDLAGGMDPGAGPDRSSNEGGAEEYSTTNTQEAGVDEADFVKNDGSTIYLLAGHELMIFDAWPPPATHLLSATGIEGKPRSLYVADSVAVVYSDLIDEDYSDDDCYCDMWECWGCWGPPRQLKVTVFDISDLSAPVLTREIVLNGSYTNSRRIGPAVHTVVNFPEIRFPGVHYWPDDLWDCDMNDVEIMLAFIRLMNDNERAIRQTELTDWLPSVVDTTHQNGAAHVDTTLLADCQNFYEPVLPSGHGFLTVLSFDMFNTDGLNLASIVGRSGEVYSSTDALYVATTYWDVPNGLWDLGPQAESGEATVIHKFGLDNAAGAASYQASGVVRGRILNQFSMGEHDGRLRVATTSGYVRHPETHNSVFVLEQAGGRLDVVGQVTGIAPTEDIRSARFVGDRGFIVTFKKTDPLFAIDLSDPTAPVLAGELKIPGFSTYIHMMDADHLLTIGFDAEDHGSFAYFQGIQLQIFDVSDMAAPTRTHVHTIGTRGTSSEATDNHLAFNYFPPKDILALPMALCEESSGGGDYGDVMTFSGLMVWDTTVADGFTERGRVSHLPPGGSEDQYACHNWWTNGSSRVKRSIVMDDFVFSISDTLLKVNHLDDLPTDLAAIELPQIPQDDPYYGW